MRDSLRFASRTVGATLTLTPVLLDRLKQLYYACQDFPARKEDLKGGRPLAA
jgi:hypothetical protein